MIFVGLAVVTAAGGDKLQREPGDWRKKKLDGLGGDEELAHIHACPVDRKEGHLPKTSFA